MNAAVSMQLNLTRAQAWLSQARSVNVQPLVIDRVHTDSRSLQGGDLFVAGTRGECPARGDRPHPHRQPQPARG